MITDDKKPFPIVPIATQKLVDAGTNIATIKSEDTAFLHATLCQCSLPRRKVQGDTFERSAGRASIMIQAGMTQDATGRWVKSEIPYGAKPRLVLHHLCTEAVRTQSPHIDVGGSMAQFLRSIGIDYVGNPRDNRHFKQQMMALAHCNMTFAFWEGERLTQSKVNPLETFTAWLPIDPNQRSLWADEIILGTAFFEDLLAHAVPLDPRAIGALKSSALALDIYTWLANRLHRVKKGGQKVSWKNLRHQFGQEYNDNKNFKAEFKKALLKVRAVYPYAKIEDVAGGLMLYNSPPPVQKSAKMYVFDGNKVSHDRKVIED